MPHSPRPERVADAIQVELADILIRRLKDPRHGFLTLTAVEVTPDLRRARIFISALSEGELEEGLDTLDRAKGFIRTELGRRIRLRFTPDLEFRADRSTQQGLRVQALLRDLEEGKIPPADDDDA
ncbi:MAG TPA: 30S ribosome-binding factor RbfA [Dongiaceae bacterium]|nr:30S ribosome-binding factor RbfA [Dongiaceae bacterium]